MGAANDMSTITTALSTAFAAIKDDVFGIVAVALPVALAIMGAILAVRIGMKFFKNTTKSGS